MVLRLLPTDEPDDPYLERICALQQARNGLAHNIVNKDPVAISLLVVIDELLEQLRERQSR